MKFSIVATTLSVATCALAAAAPATYKTVVADIAAISKQLSTLNSSVTAYKGGPADTINALTIQGQSSDLQNIIDKATKDANASPAFGDDGSNAVANAVLALEPNIFSVLDNLVAKKPNFDKPVIFGIVPSQLVLLDLKGLKTSTDKFGAATTAKLNSVFSGVAPIIIGQIDDAFNKAIAAYSKK
jgi:hypothetical protein